MHVHTLLERLNWGRFMTMPAFTLAAAVWLVVVGPVAGRSEEMATVAELRSAIERALPQLEAGASGSANERQCYTCHNQGLPVMALSSAQRHGFRIDTQVLARQLKHTWEHLHRGQQGYAEAKGQGGQTMTAGYALWTLEAGEHTPDEVTRDVCHYLLERHRDKEFWLAGGQRLPSSGSSFTSTYVALRSLEYFATPDQRERLETRRNAVAKWLLSADPQSTEDRVFHLRCLPYISAVPDVVSGWVQQLLQLQHPSGGWSQDGVLAPDAYATGSVLAALHDVAAIDLGNPAFARGVRFLLDTQLPDGTWQVATHAKPIQEYYESGFPHGDDQFISIAASGWAVLALLAALPASDAPAQDKTDAAVAVAANPVVADPVAANPVVADPVAANQATPPTVRVKHVADFEVTGNGAAAAWDKTEWVALQRRAGGVHDYDSRFKILYSDAGLYVLFDGTDRRLSASMQADFLDLWTEDVYECFFWTDESQPLYFEYEISPLGYELPILIPNLNGKFLGWRPWHYEGNRKIRKQVAAVGGANQPQATVTGWSAEVFIPFELLKPLQNVPATSGTRWRANFYRVDYDRLEAAPQQPSDRQATEPAVTQWDWARVGPSFHEYQKFGTLVFE